MSSEKGCTVAVNVTILRVEKLPSHSVSPGSMVRVKWDRGPQKGKQGTFPDIQYQRGLGEWLDADTATAKLACHMIYKSSKSFKRKKMTFKVETFHPSQPKTKKTLGKAVLNLSEHISPPGKANTTCVIPLQNRYNAGTVTVEITATPSDSLPIEENACDSDASDDINTDLEEVDGDFADRIVQENVAIDSDRLFKGLENKSSSSHGDNSTLKKESLIQVEIMMKQLEIEDLKQEQEFYSFLIDDYKRTLTALKPKKGSVNVVSVFEQQLRFMKQETQHYKMQYEEYSEYYNELLDDIEGFEERIAAATQEKFDVPPKFREREVFLRKEFLRESGKYDSITTEPTAALAVISYLHKNECEEEWLMEVLLMTRFMAINAKGDFDMLCYWFSVILCMTSHLQKSKIYRFSGDIQGLGITDDSDFDVEMPTVEQSFTLLNYELYLLTCQQIFPLIDELLEVSFFSSVTLIIDASKTIIDPSRSVEGLIQLLSRLIRRMKEASIYPVVIKQIFHQLIYYISTQLANRLLTTAELCTPTVALSIKMGLSFVEGWIQETSKVDQIYVEHSQEHLVYIQDVVGILMTAGYQEEIFESEKTLSEKFSSMSVAQVNQLIKSYCPDRYMPDKIPDAVIQAIKKLHKNSNSSQNKQKTESDVCFPTILPLKKIQPAEFNIEDDSEDSMLDVSD